MAYNANKPDATDTISSSQSVLKDNFTAIKAIIDVNHVTFGLSDQGKHNLVTIPQVTVTPGSIPAAVSATEWAFYNASGDLFLRTNKAAGTVTGDINITGGTKATLGWCYLPCGVIMKWGTGSVTASNSGAYGTATLISGASIPTITTLLSGIVTKVGTSELIVSYSSFDETAHTVTAYAIKAFSGSNTATFNYLLLGI